MTELARIEAVVLLQSADLFAFCRAEEVLRIAAIARQRQFGKGEKIYAVNDTASVLYCVVHGLVTLERPDGAARSVGPLATFGVEEILVGRLRTANATADVDTLTLAINADDFFDLLAANIEIVKALFRRFLQDGGPG